MEAVCMKIVEMSIAASWLILAVILLRLFLTKAPKGFRYILWALVAIRLICPFSIESNLSLVPDTDGLLLEETPELGVGDNTDIGETIGNGAMTTPGQGTTVPGTTPSLPSTTPSTPGTTPSTPGTTPSVPDTTPVVPDVTPSVPDTNPGTSDVAPVAPQTDAIQLADVLPWVWAVGAVLLLVYMIISYVRLWNRVKISVPIDEKIYICDEIQSPFIFGVLRPNVYIPSYIEKDQLAYILAHEREHLRCMDHMWKPIGFVLLAVHWFNPLVWVAYILMCRDLELACDERVIRHMNSSEKRNYSETLLACSSPGHYISACPVAFGEIGIKERIKRVFSYKKPTLWVMATAVLLCVVVGICFMTDPAKAGNINESEMESESESQSEPESVTDGDSETDTNSEIETGSEFDTSSEIETGSENEPETGTETPSTEKILYETTADLNHDGIADLVRTMIYSPVNDFDLEGSEAAAYIQVFAGIGDKKYETMPSYTSDSYCSSHSGNGAYCLTQKDGKDYLIHSNMYEHQGDAYYEYNVFYLSTGINVELIEVEKGDASFATSPFWGQWMDSPHREDEVPQFQQKMTPWIENATVLFVLDVATPVYVSTMETQVAAKEYYDSVWARSDEAEIQEFYEIVGSEPWKMYLYNYDMTDEIEFLNELVASDLSKWFKAYKGKTLQRIGVDGPADITNSGDIVYYKAENGEDVQSVLKKMVEAMIIPRMQESDKRSYTITDYALVDLPIIQVSDNIWLIEYLTGYYSYEGEVMEWTFEDRLEYVGEDSVNGLVPFDLEGDTYELLYMLIEENGVYRLASYSSVNSEFYSGD